MVKVRKRRLKTATDIRRYLADLIYRVEKGQMEPAKASKIGYLTTILVRVIEISDVEIRLEQMEEHLFSQETSASAE